MSVSSWMTDWNNIIRYVIFPDPQLRELMCLPENISIIDFIDHYFIRAGYTNELLEKEDVRIVYGDTNSEETDVPNVLKNTLSFDIYVRQEKLHNATSDRLMFRTHLIANRLNMLLTKGGTSGKYLGGYRFWPCKEMDLGTRTVGYVRYNISFKYMRVY
jgi:hypothetical protein